MKTFGVKLKPTKTGYVVTGGAGKPKKFKGYFAASREAEKRINNMAWKKRRR